MTRLKGHLRSSSEHRADPTETPILGYGTEFIKSFNKLHLSEQLKMLTGTLVVEQRRDLRKND